MKFLALKTTRGNEVWSLSGNEKMHRELVPKGCKNLNHAVSGKFHLDWDDSVVIDEYNATEKRDKDFDRDVLQAMEKTDKTFLFIKNEHTH